MKITTNGIVSSHNIRMWCEENPLSLNANVWSDILNEKIIGSYYCEGNLNAVTKNTLAQRVENCRQQFEY